jgi:LCP family protein required for cell wall assembly
VAVYYTWSAYDAGSRIFVGCGPDGGTSGASASSGGTSGASASSGAATTDNSQDFQAAPAATPASATARINVLFTGIDSGNGRDHALTDTLLVASIDPETKKVSLVSIPRDIANFPLWDGRTFQGKINSLMTYARLHPKEFPDGGLPTLIKEIGYLLGVPIHYYAAINLEGFVRMVDLVGGVDIVNQQQISDPTYDWFNGTYGFNLSAGPHHLDGRTALAYVRSRKGIGDSDFTRARRQQEVLLALGRKLATPAMLTRIPDLLQAAGDAVRTNFPQDGSARWSSWTAGSRATTRSRSSWARPTPTTHRRTRPAASTSCSSTWTSWPRSRSSSSARTAPTTSRGRRTRPRAPRPDVHQAHTVAPVRVSASDARFRIDCPG